MPVTAWVWIGLIVITIVYELVTALDDFVRLPDDHPHVREARALLGRAQASAIAAR